MCRVTLLFVQFYCSRYTERLGEVLSKFIDAQKALPRGKADQAIAFVQALYRIEAKIKDEPPGKRKIIRQQEAKPIIEKIKVWLDKSVMHMLPSSKMGEALTYLQNQWSRLTAYLENGTYLIDNNPAEAVHDRAQKLDVCQKPNGRKGQCKFIQPD